MVMDAEREFRSRHSLEWEFQSADHRASALTGYTRYELQDKSLYDFCHPDDLERIISCNKACKEIRLSDNFLIDLTDVI